MNSHRAECSTHRQLYLTSLLFHLIVVAHELVEKSPHTLPDEGLHFVLKKLPPKLFYATDKNGNCPAHMIGKGTSLLIVKHMQDVDLQLKNPKVFRPLKARNVTTFHCAVKNGAKKEVLECLLDGNTNILAVKDEDGKLPLHHIGAAISTEALLYLQQQYREHCPLAESTRDHHGNTPIMYLASQNADWFTIYSYLRGSPCQWYYSY